jgi:predicted RNA binding protein YcfA (HicA-like mRNA interferase family)
VWPSSKAKKVFKALNGIGWREDRERRKGGSHCQLVHPEYRHEYTWAFHDGDEIGPAMLARIANHTGLKPSHL